jgi:hypothetical protein
MSHLDTSRFMSRLNTPRFLSHLDTSRLIPPAAIGGSHSPVGGRN